MRVSWHRDAACREYPAAWWFPERGATGPAVSRRAKEICAGCPVREECLAFGLRNGEVDGIWGGEARLELRALRARARATAGGEAS